MLQLSNSEQMIPVYINQCCSLTVVLYQDYESQSSAMCIGIVKTETEPAEVDETHDRMMPVVALETLDLTR